MLTLIPLTSIKSLANQIITKEGDTLNKIAAENNLSLRDLMDTNNIYDTEKLKVGTIITIPGNSVNKNSNTVVHIVKKGETILKISKIYETSVNSIVKINKLESPDIINTGMKLFIRKGSNLTRSNTASNLTSLKNDAYIRLDPSDKWKNYGYLKINWSQWRKSNKSYITPAIHNNGQNFFIAINCEERRINATGSKTKWKDWFAPSRKFEHVLLNDFCGRTSN